MDYITILLNFVKQNFEGTRRVVSEGSSQSANSRISRLPCWLSALEAFSLIYILYHTSSSRYSEFPAYSQVWL